jgi:hypothetical protein
MIFRKFKLVSENIKKNDNKIPSFYFLKKAALESYFLSYAM